MKKLWKQRMEPFRIWGNLYFCGSVPSSCHVIDTGAGLILIDPGLPETFYLVVQGLWELGFEPRQVKAILHTHGHYDHAGATKLLLGLAPEAKTYIGAGDADTVRGNDDLSLAELVGAEFDGFFEPGEHGGALPLDPGTLPWDIQFLFRRRGRGGGGKALRDARRRRHKLHDA